MPTEKMFSIICRASPVYKSNRKLIENAKGLSSGDSDSYPFAHDTTKVNRTAIINHLIVSNNYQDYLEIGVRDGKNFNQIKVKNKTNVDPAPTVACDFEVTSDEFFQNLSDDILYDIVFIDGLHLAEQAYKDVRNALKHLKDNGTIVMHDCNPPSAFHQREIYEVNGVLPPWNGTVWKAWAQLRCDSSDITMAVINTDWGVGVIQKGAQEPYQDLSDYIYSYQYLETHRKELLNLISTQDFLDRY